jgi:glycosyltransferase involved in cell wall biosynthesis
MGINAGGPSSCTYNLLKGLQSAGINADILTIDSKNDRMIGDDPFIKTVINDTKTSLGYSKNFRNYLLRHKNYDLYHANGLWTYPTHATIQCAKQQKKPCIVAPHGMLYPQALQVSALKKKIALALFQRNDLKRAICLQATSQAELEHIRNFGLANPIALMPNCLNIDFSAQKRDQENEIKKFGFVGRLNRIKNVDILLKAWLQLSESTKKAELLIIGSGDFVYDKELRQYAIDHKMSNVSFMGFLNGNVLKEKMKSLDFLILPSKSENFGMVVPEVLINGVPVIASKGTPWEELNIHNCGWWVDNDVDTMAETIQKAMNLPEDIRMAMGKRGQELIKNNYAVEVVSKKMIHLYSWILNGGEKPEFVYT